MRRGLTFDMRRGAKGAKRLSGRPLDRGVRRLVQHCDALTATLPEVFAAARPYSWRHLVADELSSYNLINEREIPFLEELNVEPCDDCFVLVRLHGGASGGSEVA